MELVHNGLRHHSLLSTHPSMPYDSMVSQRRSMGRNQELTLSPSTTASCPLPPPRYPPCALRTRCRSCTENWAAKPWQKSFLEAVEGSRVTEIVVGGENVVANHRLANLLRHGVQKQAGRRALFRRISRQGAGVGDRYRTSLSDVLPFVRPHSHCAMLVLRFLGLALLRLLPNELIYSLGP